MDWTNLSLAQILAIFKSHFLDQAETSTAFAPPLRSRCAGHSGSGSSTSNERQKKMVSLLTAGEKLTSRRCEREFDITRDTAARDFGLLMRLGLATRQGRGRSTSYVLATKT